MAALEDAATDSEYNIEERMATTDICELESTSVVSRTLLATTKTASARFVKNRLPFAFEVLKSVKTTLRDYSEAGCNSKGELDWEQKQEQLKTCYAKSLRTYIMTAITQCCFRAGDNVPFNFN